MTKHLLFSVGTLLFVAVVLIAVQEAKTEPTPTPQAATPAEQPKITWSETHIELTLSPGESTSRNVSFTSNVELQNMVLETVPKLAGFLFLTPSSFVHVPGGTPQPVHIDFCQRRCKNPRIAGIKFPTRSLRRSRPWKQEVQGAVTEFRCARNRRISSTRGEPRQDQRAHGI